ncbi:putative T7SS-secreted protein [Streptomyces sp. XY332]|uniref:putative T7SS-secreted protein n=1 Tax=Streptomyces sp. XY332 TaxID=1415561 RepID=UPI0006BF2065|nr:polymorphic toxin type 30 domain-containing protein [Streptomyces sp. XY332]KOY55377.1 type IV secretion protein Rhs [Streptomyces sp. XY332]
MSGGNWLEKGAAFTGDAVEWLGDKAADTLEDVGWQGGANAVRSTANSAANRLGADVGEVELGQSEDPKQLVHGSASSLRTTAGHLNDFHAAFTRTGEGLKKLGTDGIKGAAADAFRDSVQEKAPRWFAAAAAFETAAGAVGRFADAVTWAQGQAKEAIDEYKAAVKLSQNAHAAYDTWVKDYESAVKAQQDPLPARPMGFTDPGTEGIKAARQKLAEARRQRDDVAHSVAQALEKARDAAPKVSAADAALVEIVRKGAEVEHFVGGIAKGTAGLVNFARGLDSHDPYNMNHPTVAQMGLNSMSAGFLTTANDPGAAAKAMLDSALKDPFEFGGTLVPEAIGPKGGGLLSGASRRAAAAARLLGDAKHLDGNKPGGSRGDHEQNPDSNSKRCSETVCKRDPVDIATGRMLLPATDIALPAALPLVFRRTFDSARRSGRWFGPTWSSTVDQRLEIDSDGVIFSCDEGSLLAYPHPDPGAPVMPTHGRQWPLDRVPGGYTITDPDTGRIWRFTDHSDELALLAQIDDRNGRWITFEHDETGAPTAIVHHAGYHLKLTTSEGRVTALHLTGAATDGSDQEILRYDYTDGHLTSVTNSSGRPLSFDCDEHGRITSWTDTNGSRFDYVYDDQDRCTYQSGTNGHLESTFTWDDVDPATGLRMTTLTNGLGHTERHLINDRSQVVAEIDSLGAVTRFEYDRYNRLLSRTDPLGHVSRFAYDEHGRMTVVERPDGRQARAEYDDTGMPTRLVGTDGNVARQTFDERGNHTSVTESSGATTAFTYDESGNITSITDALGHTSTVVSDKAGLPLSITDPLGAVTRYERDAFGRPVSITDPLGAVTRLEWTVEGKLARRIEPDGGTQVWTYDGEGNCLSHTDAMGGATLFEYTDFDLLTARTGPDGVRYEFTHDTNLRLTEVTNPQALAWTYTYDPAGRLVAETDFDDRTLTYVYDAAGRLTSRTNALAQTVAYEHNELGQVVRKDAAGAVTAFEYDIFDELAVATGPDATLVRLRDRFGRLKSETVNGRTLSFTHDALGRRTGRTTPGGAASSWSYDAAGRRTALTVSGRTLTFTHDELGRETSRTIGDFASLTSSFDMMGRLTAQEITAGGGRRLQHRAYAYRPDGNLVGITDAFSGTHRFDLDAAGRVTAVHSAGWTERYAYDEAGNQAAASWPSTHPSHESTGPRTYTGTGITRAGSVRYEHDTQGRTVLRQKTRLSRRPDTWRYAWDAEDRLTAVTTPDGTVWRYAYDPLGRRISKQSPLETVHFTWDGATLCEQTTEDTTLTWDYAGLHPLTQTERRHGSTDDRFFAIVTDLIGTPTALVDESGSLAWRTRTTLWGTTTWTRDATAYTPLRFPGQYFDRESELHYNFFRYYDPELARYLTPDPLGLTPADNPVTYVHNPHTWSDPLGLGPCPPRIEGGGWDLRGDANPLDIIPKDAVQEPWRPIPGGVEHGIKWKWTDDVTGKTVRMRVHGPDLGPHAGPNASNGPIYRIQIGGKFQDEAGNLYHREIGNSNSPNYNETAINDTHIPWPSNLPIPYPH